MAIPKGGAKEKVFCSRCKYLSHVVNEYICTHQKNRTSKNDNWLNPGETGAQTPDIMNKKNNCPWFSDKNKSHCKYPLH